MLLALALLACTDDPATAPVTPRAGVLDEGPLNPFPSMATFAEGAVAVPRDTLPLPENGTHMDVERLNWRDGFSPVQPAIVRLHVAIDAGSLSGQDALGIGGSVRMVDLDTRTEIPCFAELDIHPDALYDPAERTLIVRPMQAMPPGHTVAVVLSSAVRTADGAPLSVPAWAAAKASDPASAELATTLEEIGQTDVALAWAFPVGDARPLLRHLLDAVPVPGSFTFTRVRDADTEETGRMPPGAWRILEGTYTVPNWLADDVGFRVDGTGMPTMQGTTEAYMMALVPDSLRDAAPGSAPVVVFGHGILGEPSDYLASMDDGAGVIELANRLGAVVIATKWRGLTEDDQPAALAVAMDFGRFPELTDKLAQGVANTVGLMRLATEGSLGDAPEFGGLLDRDDLRYYGISLGGIEGAVTVANAPAVRHAAFHVAGGAWSTMLERSSNWPPFEMLVMRSVEDPADRQLLYAASQLLWDPVDPASWSADLSERSVLWQEAMEDNQVPNLTTELVVRSVGAALGTPAVTQPYGLRTVALPASGPVLTQFDPMTERLERGNRPAVNTGSHGIPRAWPGCRAQVEGFLTDGVARHFCGEGACTADNPGTAR
jgi:hypothetical protein